MRNQYMAKVLVYNKVVTEDQINTYWPSVSESKDIGQVLVEAGVLKPAMYDKVLAYVKNLEAKSASQQPAAAPAAAPAAPARPAPVAKPAPARPVEPKKEEPKKEEPAFQVEGNNIFGESSSSNISVEPVAGLETTSIATIGITSSSDFDSEDADPEALPNRFALSTGEGAPINAPDTIHPASTLSQMIAFARKFNATDIYLYPNRQVVMRQSGNLFFASETAMESSHLNDRLSEAADGFSDGYKIAVGKNFSKTMSLPGVGRARISVTWNGVTPSISIRIIQMESASLESLYLPAFCANFAELNSGLVLIAGPSESGRSTTMTTFAETIAQTREVYIQTIEKPIERLLMSSRGAITQREVGLHVKSGVSGIEFAIKNGADVICFDSLETMEELNLLLQASNAGALVFAVTTGNNIHALLSRLLASVPDSSRTTFANTLAEQLKGVIVQHLIPVVQNQGLVLAAETMKVTSTVSNMIRKCELSQLVAAISSQKDQGVTLDDSLQKCLESGYIEGSEAWKRAFDNRRFAAYRPQNNSEVQ